jgi:hypothetical protein
LQEAQARQEPDGRGDCAGQRDRGVKGDANQQGTTAPHGVAEGSGDELTGGEPDQAGGQGQLDLGRSGLKVARDLRHGREVHVDRERGERG